MVDSWSFGLDSNLDRVILSFPGAGQLTLAMSLSPSIGLSSVECQWGIGGPMMDHPPTQGK